MRHFLVLLALACALAPGNSAWGLGAREKAGPAPAAKSEESLQGWEPLLEEGARAGLSQSRLEATAARLAAAGISPEAAEPVLQPAFETAAAGLPGGWVLAKIEEGTLKSVSPEALERAARSRAEVLAQARELLAGAGFPDTPERGRGLLLSTATALESGVPEPTMAAGLAKAGGKPRGQVKAIVEAGESLHLANLDSETVAALMADCLDRNLRRLEVLRVVRFARTQHNAGIAGPAVRDALWNQEAQGHGGRGAGSGRGGLGGPSDSSGSRGGSSGGRGPGPGRSRPPRGGHR